MDNKQITDNKLDPVEAFKEEVGGGNTSSGNGSGV